MNIRSDDIVFDVGLAEDIGTRYEDLMFKVSKSVLQTRVVRPSAGDADAPIPTEQGHQTKEDVRYAGRLR